MPVSRCDHGENPNEGNQTPQRMQSMKAGHDIEAGERESSIWIQLDGIFDSRAPIQPRHGLGDRVGQTQT